MARQISIDNIEPGMILASTVKSKHNQTLLHPNTVLAEKHKQFLRIWGITSIYIVSEDKPGEDDAASETDAIREELIKRLRWRPGNAYEEDLLLMAMQHEEEMKAEAESGEQK